MAQSTTKLKLVIDTKAGRILYAEADKKFIDFLFSLLFLPVGTVVKLLKNPSMSGCLINLYASVEALNETYLEPTQRKEQLLKPKVGLSSYIPALLTNADSPSPIRALKFYVCGSSYCHSYFTEDKFSVCPSCNKFMSSECTYCVMPRNGSALATRVGEKGYVKDMVKYMVMDDLSVKPLTSMECISDLLNKFNVKDLRVLEEKFVTLSSNDGLRLLHASLHSKTVLTDVFWEVCCKSESNNETRQ